jgi:hypothetical protein
MTKQAIFFNVLTQDNILLINNYLYLCNEF